jgi:hypothetical protein
VFYARETKTTYETFEARCPHCQEWIIFNRLEDLAGAVQIDFAKVTCLNDACRQRFAINGDTVDPPFAQMLFTAFPLMERKQYGDATVAICRSYERFFAHSLYEMLVWHPFVVERYQPELDLINGLAAQVKSAIERRSFVEMRNAFVNTALRWPVATVAAGGALIADLPQFFRSVDPARLAACSNPELALGLTALLSSDVNVVRNAVIHKTAERPEPAKARALFDESRDIVWTLADELDVRYSAL